MVSCNRDWTIRNDRFTSTPAVRLLGTNVARRVELTRLKLLSGTVGPGASCASGLWPVSGAHRLFEADRRRATQRQSLRVSKRDTRSNPLHFRSGCAQAFRAGFSGAPSPDTRAAGKLVNFVFPLRRDSERARGARGELRMRTLFVFCAVALGMGCDASATELGLASFYGAQGLTAAHRSLPMGSRVKVLNLDNGRSVIVRIVDRGPFIHGRVIDVSTAAAVTLGFRDAGLAHVRIERISAETLEAAAPGLRGRRRLRPTRPRPMRSAVTAPIAWSICEPTRSATERRRCRAMRWDARISDCGLSDSLRARTIWRPSSTPLQKSVQAGWRGPKHPRERPGGYGGGREHPRRRPGRSFAAQSPCNALCEPLRCGVL